MLANVGVGVFIRRKDHDAYIHALLKNQVDPPERSHDPCLVAIIKNGDILCKAFDQPYLVRSQRGA